MEQFDKLLLPIILMIGISQGVVLFIGLRRGKHVISKYGAKAAEFNLTELNWGNVDRAVKKLKNRDDLDDPIFTKLNKQVWLPVGIAITSWMCLLLNMTLHLIAAVTKS